MRLSSYSLFSYTAYQLSGTEPVWINLQKLNAITNNSFSEREASAHFSKMSLDSKSTEFFRDRIKTDKPASVYAEIYGGSGISTHAGGARSCIFDGILIKGSGLNPVSGKNSKDSHATGMLCLVDALLETIDKFLSFETTGQSQDAQVKESSNNEDRSDHELVIEDFRSALKQELENIISAFPKISADSLYEKIKPIYLRYSNDEKVKKEKAFIDMYYIITGQKVASGAFTKLKDFLADPNGKLDI